MTSPPVRLRKVLLLALYLVPALVGLFVNYVGLLALAVFLVMTYQMWKSIEGQGARTTPGRAVGYQLLPVYGLYWVFHVYVGFATDFHKRASQLAASTGKSAPRISRGLMVARCVFFVLSLGASRLAIEPSFQRDGQAGAWAALTAICLIAIVLDAVVIGRVSDAVNWLAEASVGPATEAAPTAPSTATAAMLSGPFGRHSKLSVASSVLALLTMIAFVVMLATRDQASGAGVDLSIGSLSTLNGIFTLLTSLLGVAASVLAIVALGRRNTRNVFAAIGLSGALVMMTITIALMVSSEDGLSNWSEGPPKPRSTAHHPRLFPIVENGKWGFIDVTGRVVIEPQYDFARTFSEGLAAVNVGGVCRDAHADGGKWGFIDTTGTFVINPQYDHVGNYAEGLVSASSGASCAFLDTLGDTAFTVSPDLLDAMLAAEAGNRHYVGGLVQSGTFSEGLTPYAIPDAGSRKLGFLAPDGRVAVRPTFSDVGGFSEGLAAVRVGPEPAGRWGYVNRRGRWVIRPQFDHAGPFSEGLAAVEMGTTYNDTAVVRWGKWGYIDRRGKLTINPQFDDAEEFAEGLAAVKFGGVRDSTAHWPRGGEWGFIDHRGAYAIKPQYYRAKTFADGRASVTVAGLDGYIDKRGAFVVQPQYEYALSYRGGLAIVVADDLRYPFNPSVHLRIITGYGGPLTPDCGPWAYMDTAGRFIWKSDGWPQDSSP